MSNYLKYKPEFADQARKLCEVFGATDKQLAKTFDVCRDTIGEWRKTYPDFLDACEAGKEVADQEVEKALFYRATGYSHEAEKIFCTKDGDIIRADFIEQYPPDTTACVFWLRNRKPNEWGKTENKEPEGRPSRLIINFGSEDEEKSA